MSETGRAGPVDSMPTEGVVLKRAARVYDLLEPLFMLLRQNALHRATVDALGPQPGERYLDAGCGTGALTREIVLREPLASATGIDASGPMIEIARRKRGAPNCRFDVALAEAMPFEDASLDGVVSALFVHHVNATLKLRFAEETFRVLRPGGRIAIADIGRPWNLFGWFYAGSGWILFRQPEIKENMDGLVPHTLREAGFANLAGSRAELGCMYVWKAVKP